VTRWLVRELPLEGATQHSVQGVSHLRRAVIGEVIVLVARVLRLRIPIQEGSQLPSLPGRQIQHLDGHRAALGSIRREIFLERLADETILHPSASEVQEKILLLEIEDAVVINDRFVGVGIVHDEGIVAESLPVKSARPEGYERHLWGGARQHRLCSTDQQYCKQENLRSA